MKIFTAWIIWLGLFLPSPSQAEQRFALLVANQNYVGNVGEPLTHPFGDVEKVSVSLKQLGFKVEILRDVRHEDMIPLIRKYIEDVKEAGPDTLSFFYYSGHGAATPDHQNYLIPVDVKSTDDASLWSYSTRQADVVRELKEGAPEAKHFLVFDACRNELNLPKAATKGVGGDKGFVGIRERVGMLVAYATGENETAKDTGEYAKILAAELIRPGIEVGEVFRRVETRVMTEMRQLPFWHMTGIPTTYFTAAPRGEPCNAVSVIAEGGEICRIPGDKQQFKDCDACPEMVLVPPGEVIFRGPLAILTYSYWRQFFTSVDLRPTYKIEIAKPFVVSQFPITFDEWDTCANNGGCERYRPPNGPGDRYGHPVVNVSLKDAMNYIKWLNGESHQEYRLLSEAEFEFLKEKNADISDVCSNCDRLVASSYQVFVPDYNGKGGGSGHMETRPSLVARTRSKTLPVRSFVPNDVGLYGINDNVDELLADCWSDTTFEVIPSDGSAWTKSDCKSHTVVGGKAREPFLGTPSIEHRWAADPDTRDSFTSFRVARVLKP